MTLSIRNLLLGLGALISVLLISGLLAYQNTRQLREDTALVVRAHQELEAFQGALGAITDAETGQRGFLLTGDERYLEPYHAGLDRAQAQLRRLREGAPPQQAQVAALEALIGAKSRELEQTIALQRRDPPAARQMVLTHLGRSIMDSIRAQIAAMDHDERALLADRERTSRRGYRTVILSGAVFGLLSLGLALALLVQLQRHFRQRDAFEQALESQRQWLQVTLRSIGDAVIATDRSGAVTFLNPVAERLTGWQAEAAAGQPLEAVFPLINEQTREPAPNPCERVLREGAVAGLANHTALVARDGRFLPIEDSAAPIVDGAGQVSGMVLVFHEVSGKREAERIMRESEERFRTVFERGGVPMALITPDGRILRANPALGQMLGTSDIALAGSTVWDITHPEDQAQTRDGLQRIARGQASWFRMEKRYLRRDGALIWGDMCTACVNDAEGRPLYLVTHIQDITERKRAEASLRQANQRKDEFLATLAHELRNPLAPIRTGAFLLTQRATEDPELMQLYAMIARQAAHMARLVDDLLDVSRIERGRVELRKERVALGQVVAHALEASKALIEAGGYQLAVELPDPAPELEADPVRLEQMLCNLLNNACKYTPAGGRIQVLAAWEGAEAVLRVRDDGIGMTPEVIEHIFDLFYQANPSTDRRGGGLGIGLTLVQRLAQLHGGALAATSDGPGKGSEFVLTLPALSPAPAPAPAAEPTRARRQVLVVDDDRNVRQTLELLLHSLDYQVTAAASGAKGIELALAQRPDIALIDLGMPGMGGLEVATRIRAELGEAIRLVALTGFSGETDFAETKAAGFDHHLVKSGDPRELLQLLEMIF
ncbi:MAG: PAS domain S-box protein [Holophaga sp.]|nr:PAS domain S-box protein [Holophaga sp.]